MIQAIKRKLIRLTLTNEEYRYGYHMISMDRPIVKESINRYTYHTIGMDKFISK